jgi:hypothetical protein
MIFFEFFYTNRSTMEYLLVTIIKKEREDQEMTLNHVVVISTTIKIVATSKGASICPRLPSAVAVA